MLETWERTLWTSRWEHLIICTLYGMLISGDSKYQNCQPVSVRCQGDWTWVISSGSQRLFRTPYTESILESTWGSIQSQTLTRYNHIQNKTHAYFIFWHPVSNSWAQIMIKSWALFFIQVFHFIFLKLSIYWIDLAMRTFSKMCEYRFFP